MQEPSTHTVDPIVDVSQGQDQDQDQPSASIDENVQDVDQGHDSSQDGDSNDQDDQEILPRSNRDIEIHRQGRMKRDFVLKNHKLEPSLGTSTRM